MTFIIYVLLIHFLADFGLQTHKQSTNKSSSWKYLLYHTSVYSLVWMIASSVYLSEWYQYLIFGVITFVAHTITDYCTSRIGKPFWDKGDYHNGFVVVGFDQVLHYIQLFLTFSLFIKILK